MSFCFNWDNYALLPVLYPRITSPHFANDSAVVYGWIGASFAIAALFGSMIFGGWADKRGAREPLLVGQLIMIAGDILTFLRLNTTWNILAGRIVSGFAAGSRTCCLWYIAKTTSGEERGKMIGNWYAAGMLGMVFAPGVAALCGLFPTPATGAILSINAYNAPALSSLLLHLVAVWVVIQYVYDQPTGDAAAPLADAAAAPDLDKVLDKPTRSLSRSSSLQRDSDAGPPAGCYILIFSQYLIITAISSFETFVVPLFSHRFGAPGWVTGIVFAGIGIVVLFSAILSGTLNSKYKWSERQIELTGMMLFMIGCVLSFDFSGFFSVSRDELISLEAGSTVFIGVGFTFAFATMAGLYSRLLQNHKNGVLLPKMGYYMGWLSMAASAAKISGPLIVGYGLVAEIGSPRDVINMLVGAVSVMGFLAVMLIGCGWKCLKVEDPVSQPPGRRESRFRGASSFAVEGDDFEAP